MSKKNLFLVLLVLTTLFLVSCNNVNNQTVSAVTETSSKTNEETKQEKIEESKNTTENEKPEIKNVTSKVTLGNFSFKVNGEVVDNSKLANAEIYKIKVHVSNSKGEEFDNSYTGYKLADVLNACGITNASSVKSVALDGYEAELGPVQISSDWTLVAIEKDKTQPDNGTVYIAPCESKQGNVYARDVAEIIAK